MEEIKEYSLTNDDINRVLDPPTTIWTYPQFSSMDSIEDCFDSLGRCVFLYLTTSPTSGHWVCMFKRNNNTIEYFDSYGEKPEQPKTWISREQNEQLGQSEPVLMKLLKESRNRIYYNTFPYQKNKEDTNTCGRWCLARLICKDFSNQQFFNLVKGSGKSPDDWVAGFIYELLGK